MYASDDTRHSSSSLKLQPNSNKDSPGLRRWPVRSMRTGKFESTSSASLVRRQQYKFDACQGWEFGSGAGWTLGDCCDRTSVRASEEITSEVISKEKHVTKGLGGQTESSRNARRLSSSNHTA